MNAHKFWRHNIHIHTIIYIYYVVADTCHLWLGTSFIKKLVYLHLYHWGILFNLLW